MSQFCHNCGTKLPDDAIFCSECGTRLQMPKAAPVQPVAETPKAEPIQPVAETPKAEPIQPVAETPKAEPIQPVVEVPKPEPVHTEIKVETPESLQPAVEAPKPESIVLPVEEVQPEPVTQPAVETPKPEPIVLPVEEVQPEPVTQPAVEAPEPVSVQPAFSDSYIGGNPNPVPQTQAIPGFGAPDGPSGKKKKPKKKKTGLLVFFIIVVLLAAGAATVWFLDQKGIIEIFPKEENTTTYKEAIDLYVKGIEEQDIDTFLDAYGSFLVDEFKDGAGTEFLEETYEEYEEEAGADFKIKYEVTKEKEYTESKLKDLQQDLEDDYDLQETIEKAYDITTEFTMEGKDGSTDDRVKFLVVRIKGNWYLAEFDD